MTMECAGPMPFRRYFAALPGFRAFKLRMGYFALSLYPARGACFGIHDIVRLTVDCFEAFLLLRHPNNVMLCAFIFLSVR